MSRPTTKRKTKPQKPKPPPSRFAPVAFLSASPDGVQRLCEELATEAASRFADLTGTSWKFVGACIVQQLRANGHDLSNVENTEELVEWEASWYHPKGTFSLLLSFRAPHGVEVTWTADDVKFVARA
jgi:hypothetical protein